VEGERERERENLPSPKRYKNLLELCTLGECTKWNNRERDVYRECEKLRDRHATKSEEEQTNKLASHAEEGGTQRKSPHNTGTTQNKKHREEKADIA
jgi:hypothetical protein